MDSTLLGVCVSLSINNLYVYIYIMQKGVSQSERLAFILCPLVQSTRSKSSPSAAYFLHSFGCGVWNEFVCLFLCWLEVKITGFKISVTIISSLRLRSKSQRNKNKNRTCYCYSDLYGSEWGQGCSSECVPRSRALAWRTIFHKIYIPKTYTREKKMYTNRLRFALYLRTEIRLPIE